MAARRLLRSGHAAQEPTGRNRDVAVDAIDMRHRTRSSLPRPSSSGAGDSPSASEDLLDIAIEFTFPASDPISVVTAYRSREREELADGSDREAESTRR
jgi:hypothetical protein